MFKSFKDFYKYFFAISLLILSFNDFASAQYKIKDHPFSGTLVISLEGGLTVAKTDYRNDRFGLKGIGAIEYFLPTTVQSIFGVRLYFGGQTASGEDNRKTLNVFRTDMYILGGGLIYAFSIEEQFFPFLFGGISNLWFSPKDEDGRRAPNNRLNKYDNTTLAYDIEIGAKIPVTDILSLKLSLGFHYLGTDYFDDQKMGSENDFYATSNLGLSISFFGRKDSDEDGVIDSKDACPDTPSEIKVDEFGCPVDTDKDGIPDHLDECPDTKSGIRVDINGCPVDDDFDGVTDDKDECPDTPLGVLVDDKGCPVDNDNDDVPNYLDECPDTQPEAVVNENGCEIEEPSEAEQPVEEEVVEEEVSVLDFDKDGVPDNLDECPDTPLGLFVDQKGCAQAVFPEDLIPITDTILIVSDLVFIDGTDEIKPEMRLQLNKLVSYFQKDSFIKWKIAGHMDSMGSPALIEELALKRAAAILNYFINRELPSFQFQIEGKGDTEPIGDNKTLEGRAKNRRTEIIKIK